VSYNEWQSGLFCIENGDSTLSFLSIFLYLLYRMPTVEVNFDGRFAFSPSRDDATLAQQLDSRDYESFRINYLVPTNTQLSRTTNVATTNTPARMLPKIVVISCLLKSSFSHPHPTASSIFL